MTSFMLQQQSGVAMIEKSYYGHPIPKYLLSCPLRKRLLLNTMYVNRVKEKYMSLYLKYFKKEKHIHLQRNKQTKNNDKIQYSFMI